MGGWVWKRGLELVKWDNCLSEGGIVIESIHVQNVYIRNFADIQIKKNWLFPAYKMYSFYLTYLFETIMSNIFCLCNFPLSIQPPVSDLKWNTNKK